MDYSVPVLDSKEIKLFQSEYFPNKELLKVLLKPQKASKLDECYDNVEKYVIKNKGTIHFGWRIIKFKNLWIEACHHAIWKAPNGENIDITPNNDIKSQYILFVSDPLLTNAKWQHSNCVMPLVEDPLIHEFLFNKGNYQDQFEKETKGLPSSKCVDIKKLSSELQKIYNKIMMLQDLIIKKYS